MQSVMSSTTSQKISYREGELLAMMNLLSSEASPMCNLAKNGAPKFANNTSKGDTLDNNVP